MFIRSNTSISENTDYLPYSQNTQWIQESWVTGRNHCSENSYFHQFAPLSFSANQLRLFTRSSIRTEHSKLSFPGKVSVLLSETEGFH